ncbi:MAG: hypothetical protein RBR78_03335 [Flavobacteriaceae bacterium]|jgi:hypothetical protein|nr:hypothetical protein [Flavobacteriaceae bacterium]
MLLIIPLGFSCKYLGSSGQNTIQIAPSEFDGLFETTDFWLRESLGGGVFAYHDIKTTPFEFIITADINDDTERLQKILSVLIPLILRRVFILYNAAQTWVMK